jgi:hypothetical protein
MAIVGVESGYVDFLTLMTIIGTGGLIAFFVLLIVFIVQKVRTPKQANNITSAHHKHVPSILLLGLDHFIDFIPIKEFISQVLESKPFGKGAKKRTYRFGLPQKVNIDEANISVTPDKDEHLTKYWIQALNDLNTTRVTLRGVDSPIFIGTKNRTIAASFPFASALTWTKNIEQLIKDPSLFVAFKGARDSRIRNVGNILEQMALGVSGVDFHAVYKNVDVNYDPTMSESISERDKTDGRLERSEDKEKPTKTILLLILAIMALGIIIVVAAKVL